MGHHDDHMTYIHTKTESMDTALSMWSHCPTPVYATGQK